MNLDHQQDDSGTIIRGLVISLAGLLCIPLVITLVYLLSGFLSK